MDDDKLILRPSRFTIFLICLAMPFFIWFFWYLIQNSDNWLGIILGWFIVIIFTAGLPYMFLALIDNPNVHTFDKNGITEEYRGLKWQKKQWSVNWGNVISIDHYRMFQHPVHRWEHISICVNRTDKEKPFECIISGYLFRIRTKPIYDQIVAMHEKYGTLDEATKVVSNPQDLDEKVG